MARNSQLRSLCQAFQQTHNFISTTVGNNLSPEQLIYQIEPSQAHILWLVGHITFSFDSFVGPLLGCPSTLPPEYREWFDISTEPKTDANLYPPLEEILGQLNTILTSLCRHLNSMTDEILERPLPSGLPVAEMFRTVGDMTWSALFHAGYHCGQISMLRRVQGLSTGFGM